MLDDAEFIAEGDKKLAVALALVEGEDKDTRAVVAWLFGFGEVACYVVLVIFDFAENVEEENAHIPLEVFMVEEEFGEEAQVFAIDGVFGSVDLKHSDFELLVPVDFVAGRVGEGAVFAMSF